MRKVSYFNPSIGSEEIDEVVRTLKSGWLTTGEKTKLFESEFARYVNQPHTVALNSCTAALHLALEAIGLKAGDVVVVPTLTFAATAEVVQYFNARPLLVDCREEDFNIDVADAENRIRSAKADGCQIKAIIPVHYGGQIVDVEGICQLADQFSLKVIEDAAHCCPAFFRTGTEEEWQSVGSFSDVSCYSFYANKTITTGEGGMACTASVELAERMRTMSLHGISNDPWDRFSSKGSWYYEIIEPGFKYNLTDIASSIGIHQLRKADQFHRRRQSIAALYSEILEDVEEVILPTQQPNRIHSWHLYVLRLRLEKLSIDRGQFIKELGELGVTATVNWMPLHMHPYYQKTYGFLPEDYPVSSRIYSEIVSLPIFPDLLEEEVRYVVEQIKKVIGEHRRAVSVRMPGSSSV